MATERPLSFMKRLNPFISVHFPKRTPAPGAPKLIILFSWVGARPVHIAKYVSVYQTQYPTAEILLVNSSMSHVLIQPASVSSDLQPAVDVVRAAPLDHSSDPEVLVHLWSNGGSAMFARLRAAMGTDFPPHVTILDSSPGLYDFSGALAANMAGMSALMRMAAWPFFATTTVLYRLFYLGREDAFSYFFRVNNEVKNEACRTYLYSKADKVISWEHIEKHAKDAEAKGYVVRREVFQGSPHVAHVRADEGRYWKAVRETWEGRA